MSAAVAFVTMLMLVAVTVIGPRLLPYRAEAVLTASMAPAIAAGTELFVRPVLAQEVRVGDIIVFTRPDGASELVTHRVVGIEETTTGPVFVTRGDANPVPDSWRIPAVGRGWRYWFAVPKLGQLIIWAASPFARMLLLASVVLLGLRSVLVALWRPRLESTPASTAR